MNPNKQAIGSPTNSTPNQTKWFAYLIMGGCSLKACVEQHGNKSLCEEEVDTKLERLWVRFAIWLLALLKVSWHFIAEVPGVQPRWSQILPSTVFHSSP